MEFTRGEGRSREGEKNLRKDICDGHQPWEKQKAKRKVLLQKGGSVEERSWMRKKNRHRSGYFSETLLPNVHNDLSITINFAHMETKI
jgi:hypothetical protein